MKARMEQTLQDLRSRSEDVRQRAAIDLREQLVAEERELSQEKFSRLMAEVNKKIVELVNSADVNEKIGGILAVDELIDVDFEESSTKVTRFANHIRVSLQSNDNNVMVAASRALGRLARVGGTLTADFVDFEVKRALEWLMGARQEPRRYAAVLVLKELAENTPTLFYVHVNDFIKHIWAGIRDQKVFIREAAAEAAGACFKLLSERQGQKAKKWLHSTYDEARKGMQLGPEGTHGSLLVYRELLKNNPGFLCSSEMGTSSRKSMFEEVLKDVLSQRGSKDRMVKKTVIELLPIMATYDKDDFLKYGGLEQAIEHLLAVLKKETGEFRAAAYLSLGELAVAAGNKMTSHLNDFVPLIKDGVGPKKGKPFYPEAMTCISKLASAMGKILVINGHMIDLLNQMFNSGLSQTLIDALTEIVEYVPQQLTFIQERLLKSIMDILGYPVATTTSTGVRSATVTDKVYTPKAGAPTAWSASVSGGAALGSEEMTSLLVLALKTLGTFNFKDRDLITELRESIVKYLDDNNIAIRKQATETCSQLLLRTKEDEITIEEFSKPVRQILDKLLVVGVTDPDPSIRNTVLSRLDGRFDQYLAQADSLKTLFISLNDENFSVRKRGIEVIGRLTPRNPAYVMPMLRKVLIQLLTELEYSEDPLAKEESARLIGGLTKSSQRLMKPYVAPVLRALLPKLRDSNAGVVASVLSTIGDLARVGGPEIRRHRDELMPLIIESLQDQGSQTKREIALRTLGQLVEHTGDVIDPYIRYPYLRTILLSSIQKEESPEIRQELMFVMGTLGAVDPHYEKRNRFKGNKHTAPESSDPNREGGRDGNGVEDTLSPNCDDYYPSIVVENLMKILKDPSLSSMHNMVITAVIFIFKTLGMDCVPYLPQIVPPMLSLVTNCERSLRDFLFQQLGTIVSIVRQHIRAYVKELLDLIRAYWNEPSLQLQIITLIEEISTALKDEFKPSLPLLLPQMLAVLTDRSARLNVGDRGSAPQLKVLSALEVFGTNLDDCLHMVVPAVMKVISQDDTNKEVRVKAIVTLRKMSFVLDFSDFASRIVHPLCRILDCPPSAPSASLKVESLNLVCALAVQMGRDFKVFVPMISKIIQRQGIQHPNFQQVATCLIKNQPISLDDLNVSVPLSCFVCALINHRIQPQYSLETHWLARRDDGNDEANEGGTKKLHVNAETLMRAWEASQTSTKEDWNEWMRRFSVELLRESPSPALRSCAASAQVYHPLARELFNASFVSCWTELNESEQESLVRSLEIAFDPARAPNVPPEILQALLNLAEFMEHDEKPLPIDIRKLGAVAQEKCKAYAKALHYKEMEFLSNPANTIESLITINNQLQQPESAIGILRIAQECYHIPVKERWHEELNGWEEALRQYQSKLEDDDIENADEEVVLGIMRCLRAMGEWDRLSALVKRCWVEDEEVDPEDEDFAVVNEAMKYPPKDKMASIGAAAAWNLSEWDEMDRYVSSMDEDSVEGSFYRAVYSVHSRAFPEARSLILRTRKLLDTELTALVGESYNRAYNSIVMLQQLTELEEVIDYIESGDSSQRREDIREMWDRRLRGNAQNVDVWAQIIAVRTLVVKPQDDINTWIKFASLCLKSNRQTFAEKVLLRLLGEPLSKDLGDVDLDHAQPEIAYAVLKHLWAKEREPHEVFAKLFRFTSRLKKNSRLQARCFHKLGEWKLDMNEKGVDPLVAPDVLSSFKRATEFDSTWYKAWHSWALLNFQVVSYYEKNDPKIENFRQYLAPAVNGFFRSISLGQHRSLQDILRLLSIWFNYGNLKEVEAALIEGFNTVTIDTWLEVIPQIIARIDTPDRSIHRLIYDLLCRVGRAHPQSLIYPLTVASKSSSTPRRNAALAVMTSMQQHSHKLVEQAQMISAELIRIAVLWIEQWHTGLDEASRLFFGERNTARMLDTLAPLHAILEESLRNQHQLTQKEIAFQQAYGRDLQEAYDWCRRFIDSRNEADLNQAWDLYYHVFRKMNKQLPLLTTLDLEHVSPKLLEASDLEIAVPGTYRTDASIVCIKKFAPTLKRKCTILGNDGREYNFLLKGHEDMRQDERVMQLFGLVNNLLASDRETSKFDLAIQRYAVIPLSQSSGLVGWVPNCDTLHALIREYRESRRITLNIEHRMMMQMAPKYESLTLLQKVEVFQYGLEQTTGQDLNKVLWLKSKSAEVWLERRTNYTRSLAVMSMVGYILGLGDRHPSNIMLDRKSGKILHIDFGDCFEVAMHRDKFPERIPFRLTRMIINAMEVSGIEGNFRSTCERVMAVLRDNKDSLMAMLEAFVYDPLISWKLLTGNKEGESPGEEEQGAQLGALERNVRAVEVVTRISDKLTGRDFNKNQSLPVKEQVRRLINEARSHENLCRCYIGWCPFW